MAFSYQIVIHYCNGNSEERVFEADTKAENQARKISRNSNVRCVEGFAAYKPIFKYVKGTMAALK